MWINPYRGAIANVASLPGPPNVRVLCFDVMT